jgi:hypothetical protein|tara:strand:- start:2152 stop:2418 length:267 start_codon:yes stop_codon:yes gene_type:complete
MQSSFLANSSVKNVSAGMMAVVDSLHNFSKAERHAIILSVFNCLYNNKLQHKYSITDVMMMVDTMREECKRTKVPEFGGAERYIKGEL